MSKQIFYNTNFQRWLFLIGGTAFLLLLFKNIFLDEHPGAVYYVIEFLAFLFFLAAIFLSDKNNEKLRQRLSLLQASSDEKSRKYNHKIEKLQDIIEGFEKDQNESLHFKTYQDQIIGKLTSDERVYQDKHHLLHMLSELFHGMAVVLFKKEEPSGSFIVEATYGLPEGFVPDSFEANEGLHGQAVADGKPTLIEEIPEDYVPVNSGLGDSNHYFLYMLPVVKNNDCTRLIELMSFREADIQRLWPEVMEQLTARDIL